MSAVEQQALVDELPELPTRRVGSPARAWTQWLLRRVGLAILTLLAVSIIVFFATNALGDPVRAILGKDYDDALKLVEDDKAVAFAMDDILLFGLMANSRNPAALEVVGDTLQVEPYGCMLRKDDPEFKKLVDGTISRLMKTGEFSRLYSKWFESPIPPKGMNLNMPMSAQLKENLTQQSDKPAQ